MVKREKKIVCVGLSGGVDSSVSAALLKEQGFSVRGVFIKVWSFDKTQDKQLSNCTQTTDRLDAMRVCAKLDIPFHTLDLEKEYKKEVVDYMIAEYKAGRTPNPDVMCNKYIKFGGFFDWAMKQGADFVATGHYTRIKDLKLLAGKDKNKDQSYFLWTLTQKQLSRTLFPVGDLEKPQVRRLARKFGLDTATKKDSQGVCFIGKIEMADFLKEYIKPKRGNVLNERGEVIGTHDGVFYYTLGQRHGFTITRKTASDDRYFIISKDLKNNTLTVSHNPMGSTGSPQVNEKDLTSDEIKVKNVNWISGTEPDFKKEYSARVRYRQPLEACKLVKNHPTERASKKTKVIVKFTKPQKSPTPGQSVVIYDGEVCLGGGIIV